MARGDPIYGRVDVDWFDGEKTSKLTPYERNTYINGLWLLAVKLRRDRLTLDATLLQQCCKRSATDARTVQRHLATIARLGLITIHEDNSITINRVKELHPRLHWKEYEPPSPYGASRFPIRGIYDLQDERGEGRGVLGYSFIKPSSLLSSTPPDKINPAVIEKKSPGQETHNPNPSDSINSIEKFKAAQITDPDQIDQLTDEIILTLNLDQQAEPDTHELVTAYPPSWIRDALLATRDKQLRTLEGTDAGFTTTPLTYMAGTLLRKLRDMKSKAGKGQIE